MRLELGHREAAIEQGFALVEDIEHGAISLSGSGDHAAAFASILADVQTFRIAIGAVHDFEGLVPTIQEFEGLVILVRDGQLALDVKVGGVFMHVVSAFRHALTNLGTGSRTARMLPKILQDLNRVMKGLKDKMVTPIAVESAAPKLQLVPDLSPAAAAAAVIDEYRELFLRDEAGNFAEAVELSRRLATDPHDRTTLAGLFRLMHTIKGNSLALGFEGMAGYAHAFEDLLVLVQMGRICASTRVARMIMSCADAINSILGDYRMGGNEVIGIEDRIAELRLFMRERESEAMAPASSPAAPVAVAREAAGVGAQVTAVPVETLFFLSVRLSGREVLIPCAAVAQVVRKPCIMALPGGRKGWLGAIRSGGLLIPLVDPNSIIGSALSQRIVVDKSWPTWSVILSAAPADAPGERALFAVPVDDVGAVTELPFGMASMSAETLSNSLVLDIPGMINKIW